jgi:hypothetical protein
MNVRILSIAICFFLFVSFDCFQNKYEVVNHDKKNNRLFIVVSSDDNTSSNELFKQIVSVLKDIKKDRVADFKQKALNISFFHDKVHANYKPTDSKEFESWKKSYIAEYKHRDSLLVILPLDYNNLKKGKISL